MNGTPRKKPPGTPTSTSASSPRFAEPELGVPGGEWRSRGYLPHRDRIGLVQSITFRLADTLPAEKLAALEEELRALPEERRLIERRKRIELWLDSGAGCCALRHPEVAACVERALLHFDGERYRLIAWCIMPNHVHVLIEPLIPLDRIVKSWKTYTGRWAMARNAELELGVPGKAFWMRDYWDRYIRDEAHHRSVVEYIHQNPVKAGLCSRPDDWRWSSASRSNLGKEPGNAPGNAELQLGHSQE